VETMSTTERIERLTEADLIPMHSFRFGCGP
jgi:hypothetical protein